MSRPREALRDNGLSIVFGLLFLATLVAMALVGWHDYNHQQLADGLREYSFGRYLTSSNFSVDVAENWQSEYLQFLLFIWLTVWLVQKGSPESKNLDDVGAGSDEEQKVGAGAKPDSPLWARVGGWRTHVYSNSLVIVMALIFFASWFVQSIAGVVHYNHEQIASLQAPIPWTHYLVNADFWSRTLQNWQSEFLAVGSMAILSVYLRQRGSGESKPVGESHEATAVTP